MGATRFYFPSAGAADVTVANDSWNQTAGAGAALDMIREGSGTAMTTITVGNNGVIGNFMLLRQYVGEPIPFAQTISGKVRGQFRVIESNGTNNDNLAISIRACSQDGGTIRSPALLAISASDSAAAPDEMTTTLTNNCIEDSTEAKVLTLTSCTISAGDRLVIELGYRNGITTTSRTGGINFGDDNSIDLPVNQSETGALNPWVEFDSDIFVRPGTQFCWG